MGRIVEPADINNSVSTSVTVGTGSTQVLPTRLGRKRRTDIIITNLSPTTVYLSKGDQDAVTSTGIVLQQNQSWLSSDDAGSSCWQGAVNGIATSSSTVAVEETFEN